MTRIAGFESLGFRENLTRSSGAAEVLLIQGTLDFEMNPQLQTLMTYPFLPNSVALRETIAQPGQPIFIGSIPSQAFKIRNWAFDVRRSLAQSLFP